MEYRLLGPVEVEHDGRLLRLGGPKQRAVLAILLLRRGTSVPADVLVDELWGESAPPTARNALQGYVFQLRKVLEPEVERGQPHRVLVSDGAGYHVNLEPGELDLDRFERLTAEARNLLPSAPAVAAARLDEALALWRGPPLADLAFEPFAQAEVLRLDELRLAAQEDRFDALLATGRHADLVADLEALVDRHPLRERLHGQLLLALYRAGRQSDALAAYARSREELVEQLGVEPGEPLRELHRRILQQDPGLAAPPPPSRTEMRPPPRPAARLVGRAAAVEEVASLLRRHRIVTLLGPGGIGKTRLALAVAERAAGDVPDAVAWVPLETVRDPGLALAEIGGALGTTDELAVALEGRRVLLVLDNLEQVLDCAGSLAELVARTSDVRLLVTSREPLDIAAERRYQVPLLESEAAVELFRDRAEAVGAAIPDEDAAIRAICDRLEGLPLAVELAAARTAAFSPGELLRRLAATPDVLAGTRRDAPERHRTLRATIEWSYSLLDEDERSLFARLGVFAGGWSAEAAETVAGADANLLESLVEKSLVRRDGERLSMLESIRRFSHEQLEAGPDAELLSRRHAQFVAELVRALDRERPDGWLLAFDREHANFRAALDWAIAAGAADLALELAHDARTFWETHGFIDEGSSRLHEALALPGATDSVRSRGLYAAGILEARALRYAEAERLHREAVALCRGAGDEQGLARALNSLGIALYHLDRLDDSEQALGESLALKRRLGDERGAAIALLSLGNTALAAGDLDGAERSQREALDALRAAGDELGVATALDDLAGLRLLAGDHGGAQELLEESLALSRRLGALANVASTLARLGHALTALDRERADELLVEALTLFRSLGEAEGIAATLEAFAGWWLPLDASRAAALLGAAESIRARARARPQVLEERIRDRVHREGAELLGDGTWAAAVATGRSLKPDAAMATAAERQPAPAP